MNQVHFSSKTDQWETPKDFFEKINAEFRFTLDVCALPENAKCPQFFSPDDDGLAQRWTGICWMNPPYGRQIGQWVKKARQEAEAGATVVCLLPARTDTRWFHQEILPHAMIRFLPGRLRFGGAANAAPFPSMLVIFENEELKYLKRGYF